MMEEGGRGLTAAEKHYEDDDPFELVGVRFPMPEGVDADREVVRCFVEDYALMGWSRDQVRRLFEDQHYAGTFDVASRRGMELVEEQLLATFGPSEGDR